ncbi:MAG TPA: tetratricopeptide repeat protein, partial [bacterium]|nr:tetratricopeptide repeat protein [bacterium]
MGLKRGVGIGILALLALGRGPAGAEDFLYAPGRWAYDRGDYQKARDIFQGELQNSPNDADAAYGLGNSLYQLGQYDQASQAYQKCLQDDPKLEAGWYNLGNSLYQQKDYQGAAQSYQKALDLDPKDQDAARNLKLARSKIPPSP